MKRICLTVKDEMEGFEKVLVALWEDKLVPSDVELIREAVLTLEIEGGLVNDRVRLTDEGKFEFNYDYEQYIKGGDKLAILEKDYWESEFFTKGAKIDMVIDYLRKNLESKRGIAWFWEVEGMDLSKIAACLVHLYCRISDGKLYTVANFRANDAYRHILLDLDMLRATQAYMARKLGLEVGSYFHFVDSLHMRKKYEAETERLYKIFKVELNG